jgi:hypothetical protein
MPFVQLLKCLRPAYAGRQAQRRCHENNSWYYKNHLKPLLKENNSLFIYPEICTLKNVFAA